MKTKSIIVILIGILHSLFLSLSFSKDYYVKVDGTGDGSSWEKAMNADDFAKILSTVESGSTFYLSEGTYQPCYCGQVQKCGGLPLYRINSSINIIGGFPRNAKNGDKNDPEKYPTIMNGMYNGASENLFMDGENPISLYLEGLKMKYAKFAVYLQHEGKLRINKCEMDSTTIITPNVESIKISNSSFKNTNKECSFYPYPLIIFKTKNITMSNVEFENIEKNLIDSDTNTLVSDTLIMKNVTVRNAGGYVISGKFGYGLIDSLYAVSNGINITDGDEFKIINSKISATKSSNRAILFYGKKLSINNTSIEDYYEGITLLENSYKSTTIDLNNVSISCAGNKGSALYLNKSELIVKVKNSEFTKAKNGIEIINAKSVNVSNSVMSGNSDCGLYSTSLDVDVTLENNYIGVKKSGNDKFPNQIGVSGNVNNFVAKGNVISGNDSEGISLNKVNGNFSLSGNYIGTNRNFKNLGNGSTGVVLYTIYDNYRALNMAPSSLNDANYIGYNKGNGICTMIGDHSQLYNSMISYNYIGVTPDGKPMPNKMYGILVKYISVPSYSFVGAELLIKNNHLGFNKLGDVKADPLAWATVSENVFYGNEKNAIEMDNLKDIPNPKIYNVKIENDNYVVYGSVSKDPSNKLKCDTVELFCTTNEPQSALKYIASIPVNEDKFSYELTDVPELNSETVSFVVTGFYGANKYRHTTGLSNSYCVCTPKPQVVEKTVTIGTPFIIENCKFYYSKEGQYEEVIISTGENGCQKNIIVKVNVLHGDMPTAYYVKENGAGDMTGSSWENAMSADDFTAICGSVPDGTTFYLAEGNYKPMLVYGYAGFYLNSDIRIIGGYPSDAKTGAERVPGTYSTIDASDLGVQSYLFRRSSTMDALNIYLEGLEMKNVMNAIETFEGTEGNEVTVVDCVFDNAPIVFDDVENLTILSSTIKNITEDLVFPIVIDTAENVTIAKTKFENITGNVFKSSNPYIKNLEMTDVALSRVEGSLYNGKLGDGKLIDVTAQGVPLYVSELAGKLLIEKSKFSRIDVEKKGSFVLKSSEIVGSGVVIGTLSNVDIENTTIDNQNGNSTCLSLNGTNAVNVTMTGSILKNGANGYSYNNGYHTIKESYIIGNTVHGIYSINDYRFTANTLELIDNHIGVGPDGKAYGNGMGVYANADKFIAKNNVISGNKGDGIKMSTVNSVVLEGNYIGTDESYNDLGNDGCGVNLKNSGGVGLSMSPASFDDANVIGFNGGDGVIVCPGSSTQDAVVSHNYIGVTKDGTPIPNKGYGINAGSGYNNRLLVHVLENHIGNNEKGDVLEDINSYISKNLFYGNAKGKAIENATGYKESDFIVPVINDVRKEGDDVIVSVYVRDHCDVDVELYETMGNPQSAVKYLKTVTKTYSDEGNVEISVPFSQLGEGEYNNFVAIAYYHNGGTEFTTELSSVYTFVKPYELGEYYVKENGSGDGTGSSWENAMSAESFAKCIPYVTDHTTFHMAAGNYTPLVYYGYGNYNVKASIKVIGGYPAEAKTGAKSNPKENLTIMDGDSMPTKTYLFTSYGSPLHIELDGLYMRNVMSAVEGGEGSVVVAKNCEFSNAPIVLSNSDSLSLVNCVIKNITEESDRPSPIVLDSLNSLTISSTIVSDIYDDLYNDPNLQTLRIENSNMTIGGDYIMGHVTNAFIMNTEIYSQKVNAYVTDSIAFEGGKLSSTLNTNSSVLFVDDKSSNCKLSLKGITLDGGVTSSTDKVYLDSVLINGRGITGSSCLYATHSSDVFISNSQFYGSDYGIDVPQWSVNNLIISNSVISGNKKYGIKTDGLVNNIKLIDNIIGLTEDEREVYANGVGVSIQSYNFIATGNVISGNTSSGIEISNRTIANPSININENYIGVTKDHTLMPNEGYGIYVSGIVYEDSVTINNNFLGGNKKGDIKADGSSIISKNVFYGNDTLAIQSIVEAPIITSVMVDNGKYVVNGEVVVTDNRDVKWKTKDATIELFATNENHQSALKYITSTFILLNDGNEFSMVIPELSEDTSCLVAIAIFNMASESKKDMYSSQLSDPYCLCTYAPGFISDTVLFGQPSAKFGEKYNSFLIGEQQDIVTSTEDGCTKVTVESFVVLPLNSTEYYVKENGTGDGSSWENAMSGDAFAAYLSYAPEKSTFHVAAGTYQPLLDMDLRKAENSYSRFYMIKNDVTIIGGYPHDAKEGDVAMPENYATIFTADFKNDDELKADSGIVQFLNREDNSTYLFYVDKDVKEANFEGVQIVHAKNGICTDLAPNAQINVSNSKLNYCDAAVKVSLMLSSLKLNHVNFEYNENAVSSGSIYNTEVNASTFVHHLGTPLNILSNGEIVISNSFFDGNYHLPIVAGSTSDITISSSTISNTLSEETEEPIIESRVIKMDNSTLVGNNQGIDWIKADSIILHHNTLLGIKGFVGRVMTDSNPVFSCVGNIFGYDSYNSIPGLVTELLPDNLVGLTRQNLPNDVAILSANQMEKLLYKEGDDFVLVNKGGIAPVVVLKTDTLEDGSSIRIERGRTGLKVDQRSTERLDQTCMGAYEFLAPVNVLLYDTICFGEITYTKNGFNIQLEDSVVGDFNYKRMSISTREDTLYKLALTVRPQLKITNVQYTASTCINEPNGMVTFDLEGGYSPICHLIYDDGNEGIVKYIETKNNMVSFAVKNVRDKTFTIIAKNGCEEEDNYTVPVIPIPAYSISITDKSTTDLRCSYSKDGVIEVIISGGHDLSKVSMNDSIALHKNNVPLNPDTILIDSLGAGVYSFSYQSTENGCTDNAVAYHTIKAPEPIVFVNYTTNATCYGQASGELDIVPIRNGDSILFVNEKSSVNYAKDVKENKTKNYRGKFSDIDSIGFTYVSFDASVNMYNKEPEAFFNDALQDAVDLSIPMDALSKPNEKYTEFKYPESWLGYTAMYPGIYQIRVKDSKGCYFEQNFEIKNPETKLEVTMEYANAECDANSRRVKLNATGGWTPYQFVVTKSRKKTNQDDDDKIDLSGKNQGGLNIGQDFEPDTSLVQNGDIYTYTSDILSLDTLSIMVIDRKGCVDTVVENLIVDARIKVSGEEVKDRCAQPKDHSIKVNLGPEFSKKAHSYDIRYANKEIKKNIAFVSDGEGNDIISGLPSGKVGVFAYADGCSGYSTVEIEGDTAVSYIPYVAIKLDSVQSCPNMNSGELTFKVYGSYPPYQFFLDSIQLSTIDILKENKIQTIDNVDTLTSTVQDTLRVYDLPGGKHSIWVKDRENCIKEIKYDFKEPDPIHVVAAASSKCPNEDSARIYVSSISGGTAPYLYALNESQNQDYEYGESSYLKIETLSEHQIRVKDANGCISESNAVKASTGDFSELNVSCLVSTWHGLDDVVAFIDVTDTKNAMQYDSVRFELEGLPEGVTYSVLDPDLYTYGVRDGDTVYINKDTIIGPVWGVPDKYIARMRSEIEISEMDSLCTKEMILEKFTRLVDEKDCKRMRFIHFTMDSMPVTTDGVLFNYSVKQISYIGGCDVTTDYNSIEYNRNNYVVLNPDSFYNFKTKDFEDFTITPNPVSEGSACNVSVTMNNRKDFTLNVFDLSGKLKGQAQIIRVDNHDWNKIDDKYNIVITIDDLTYTSIVRVNTDTDAASQIVIVTPKGK